MNDAIDGIKELTRQFIQENPKITFEQIMEKFELLSSEFQTNEIFLDVIGPIYEMESCNYEIKNESPLTPSRVTLFRDCKVVFNNQNKYELFLVASVILLIFSHTCMIIQLAFRH